MKIIDDIKQKINEYNSIDNRYERAKNNSSNQKARKELQKIIKNNYNNIELSEEQEAILFSQAYKLNGLKNPSAAKFPQFDEYEISKLKDVYKISGYTDSTNSYGAQVRETYSMEILKQNNEWACISDSASKKAIIWLIIILLSVLVPIIMYISAMNDLNNLF